MEAHDEQRQPDEPADEDLEITDEDADQVTGGSSNVIKTQQDQAAGVIRNIRP